MSSAMSRVLCRRGVGCGVESCAFTVDQLLAALDDDHTEHVYIAVDSCGRLQAEGLQAEGLRAEGLRAEGLRAEGLRAARLCVRAALAPSVAARSAHLTLCGPLLRLRTTGPLAPLSELQLWFAEDALAALAMPFLTPRNIRGRRHYVCHACGAAFPDPNPLKLHLFLDCAPFEPRAFWRRAAARLRTAGPAPPGPRGPPGPAELEALAAACGRSRAGHVCVYCGKLYSRRYGLKIHIRTHTGYRPLRCRYCLRAFGDPSNLNKHVRLHAARAEPGARFACALCGRQLARRRDLERHARAHARAAGPGEDTDTDK